MSYSAVYKDENGVSKTISITEDDSREALKNDYEEIKRKYNPQYVTIDRIKAKTGEALHLRITAKAKSHYLNSKNDCSPKECNMMDADIICYPGYPLKPVTACYREDYRLASPNVFVSGAACIDSWIPFTSSLITVVDKLLHDMIHDANVTRYDSPACADMIQWHKRGVAAGAFPTIKPKLLYAPELSALPPRRSSAKVASTPPQLPGRRR